jgi:hypothetical protein
MTLEDDLRSRFARTVEELVPDPEPYRRLAHRRRRSTRRRTLAGGSLAAALVAGALAVPGVSPLAAGGGGPGPAPSSAAAQAPNDGAPIESDWMRQLLAEPTRGTLGADYVRGLADTARQRRAALDIAQDLNSVAVLFVDDVGAARVALVAFHSSTRVTVGWHVAGRGATADQLMYPSIEQQGGGQAILALASKGTLSWSGRPDVSLDALIAVLPTDCQIATSSDPAHQHWVPEPTGSYLVHAYARASDWWRVSCAGTVRYEGPARAVAGGGDSDLPGQAEVDAAVSGARGVVDRSAASGALVQLANMQPQPTGPARVLWGGDLPGVSRAGSPAAVAAVPVAGGWVVAAWWPQDPAMGDVCCPPAAGLVTTDADLGAPGSLFGLRPAPNTPLVLVLAPRGAASAVALAGDRPVATATLTNGVGMLNVAGNEPLTLRALDAHGQLLATYLLGPHDDDPELYPGPTIDNW